MKVSSDRYEVVIKDRVKEVFAHYMQTYSFNVEAGGILIGRVDNISSKVFIEDLTEPYEYDIRTRNRFIRAELGHQTYMDRVWEESEHTLTYIGEWHTHDQKNILASPIDHNNWVKISKKKNNADCIVFVILGRNGYAVWTGINGKINKYQEEIEVVE